MSRRSPMNARYQKFTEPEGKTRKSAAAAKPKRKQGTAAEQPKKKPGPGSKYYEPDTPEYKFWQRLWWWGLGGGALAVVISLYVNYIVKPKSGPLPIVANATLILAYVFLIGAFVVDWFKLKPMRQGTYKKKTPSDKSGDSGTQTPGDGS